VPHAGICAGGRSKERSLPRSELMSRRSPDVVNLRVHLSRVIAGWLPSLLKLVQIAGAVLRQISRSAESGLLRHAR